MTTIALAFLAGALSILAPCVLPLLPIVLSSAASEHRWGPAALAGGLALSFTAIGLFVATLGFALGLDAELFRKAGAILLIAFGLLVAAPSLSMRVAAAAGPISDWTEQRFGRFSTAGLGGQFGVGLLLGAVWSPCVGPTLGAASVLASQGENLGAVALTMLAFGVGAAAPLLALGFLSREAMLRWRGRMMSAGAGAKVALGALFVLAGVAILTGADKAIEARLVDWSPAWLTTLTTKF